MDNVRESSRGRTTRPNARSGGSAPPILLGLTSRSDVVDEIVLGQLGGGTGGGVRDRCDCGSPRGGATSTGRHGGRLSDASRRANARAVGDRRRGGDVSCAGHLDRSRDTSRRACLVWSGSDPSGAPSRSDTPSPRARGVPAQTTITRFPTCRRPSRDADDETRRKLCDCLHTAGKTTPSTRQPPSVSTRCPSSAPVPFWSHGGWSFVIRAKSRSYRPCSNGQHARRGGEVLADGQVA